MRKPPRLFHFSEDPTIARFLPHVAATATSQVPRVWAVDQQHAPAYWFPRDCPRACCWLKPGQSPDLAPALLRGGARGHYVQTDWRGRIDACALYAYEFDPAPFELLDAEGGFWIARTEVVPLARRPVGNLVERHNRNSVPLYRVDDLRPVIDAIIASGLGFSIIRAGNL